MLTVRKSKERGNADHGWLKSQHTFSFANFYDPNFMGFKSLRVINEDRIIGGRGFGAHSHRDMEIISYVIEGALEHKDSMGTRSIIKPGEVQRMSAGTGVTHSEDNAQKDKETHFFQIWILPNEKNVQPGYGHKSFVDDLNSKKLVHVISPDGKDGTISIKQNADMYISRLKKNEELNFKPTPGRGLWLQLVRGHLQIGDKIIKTGDALFSQDEKDISIKAKEDSELILFDIA